MQVEYGPGKLNIIKISLLRGYVSGVCSGKFSAVSRPLPSLKFSLHHNWEKLIGSEQINGVFNSELNWDQCSGSEISSVH